MTDGESTTTYTLADGQQIACATRGSGSEIVCVPGGPARAVSYLGDLGRLDRHHTLRLLDNRGSGGSKAGDITTFTVDRMAADLVEVVGHLGPEPPALLGHSFGTRVIAKALALQPNLASALVLVTPALLGDGEEFTAGRRAILADREDDPVYSDAVEAARAMPTARPRDQTMLYEMTVPLWYGRWDDVQQQHASRQREEVAVRAAMSIRGDLARWSLPDLSAVESPVLVVGGSLDFLTPPAAAHAVKDLFTNGAYAEIDGAGHFPWVDEPDTFVALVHDFLADNALA